MDAITRPELIQLLTKAHQTRRPISILNHNLHSIYLYSVDEAFRSAYDAAGCIYIDGMPIVWLSRAAGVDVNKNHRITFLDCFDALLREAERRCWRLYYLGSTEDVQQQASALIRRRFPQLHFQGSHGYFSKCEQGSREAIARINAASPDILFVGLGMPLQEKWLVRYRAELKVPAVLTSGATLDYLTGGAYRPPAFVGALGLYGIFRLMSDPRRLWRRYLLEPIQVTRYLLRQKRDRSSKLVVFHEAEHISAPDLKQTANGTEATFAKGA